MYKATRMVAFKQHSPAALRTAYMHAPLAAAPPPKWLDTAYKSYSVLGSGVPSCSRDGMHNKRSR